MTDEMEGVNLIGTTTVLTSTCVILRKLYDTKRHMSSILNTNMIDFKTVSTLLFHPHAADDT